MEKVTPSLLIEISEQEVQNPKMLRVVLTENHTRIDFGYTTPWFYKKGGWIKISPESYLKLKKLNKKFPLLNAEGIAIAPKRLDFQSTEDWQFFSLYFEPIPRIDCEFDMIESDKPTKNDFNYYGVVLNIINGIELV
jgi:hypothetical protein